MELRHITSVAARMAWIVALAALISACLVLAAGAAQADREPIAAPPPQAAGASAVPGPVADPQPDRGDRPNREQRAQRRQADGSADGKAGDQRARPRLPEVENAAGEPLEVSSEACQRNLAIAAKQGLRLPDGWRLDCVGGGLDWNGGSHWGVTCPYDGCPEGSGPYVSVSNPTYYVIAHELCHANFGNDELMADRCAAKHGASLETSPYS